jgi:hypothetical protein
LIEALKNFFFLEILRIKILREHFDRLLHWVSQFDALDCTGIIRQDWPQLSNLGDQVDLVVDSMALYGQNKLLRVVFASEVEFLVDGLVVARGEHNVYRLPLAWLEGSALGENMEPFSVLCPGRSRDVSLEVIRPVASHLLLVFKPYFDSFAVLDAHLSEIKGV